VPLALGQIVAEGVVDLEELVDHFCDLAFEER